MELAEYGRFGTAIPATVKENRNLSIPPSSNLLPLEKAFRPV